MEKKTHAVTFHYFHSCSHPKGQGSLSASELSVILDYLDQNYTLLNASDYHAKAVEFCLGENDICLAFDDGLLSQFDVALKVLEERGLSAFFFVYSAPFRGEVDWKEVLKYLCRALYRNDGDFYADFFSTCEIYFPAVWRSALERYPENYLECYPFYSRDDRFFRFLRDVVFDPVIFSGMAKSLIDSVGVEVGDCLEKIWMSERQLQDIHALGHVIGLHSYHHVADIRLLNRCQQSGEYSENLEHLSTILGSGITSMAHPFGFYNETTLQVLEEMGIVLGFSSSMSDGFVEGSPLLQFPRKDCSEIIRVLA